MHMLTQNVIPLNQPYTAELLCQEYGHAAPLLCAYSTYSSALPLHSEHALGLTSHANRQGVSFVDVLNTAMHVLSQEHPLKR